MENCDHIGSSCVLSGTQLSTNLGFYDNINYTRLDKSRPYGPDNTVTVAAIESNVRNYDEDVSIVEQVFNIFHSLQSYGITLNDIFNRLEQQMNKCALTGVDLRNIPWRMVAERDVHYEPWSVDNFSLVDGKYSLIE